jgi:hypothetical protein
MELINYNDDSKKYRNKNKLAPQLCCRGLIVGKTGSGKTNMLCNLIYDFLEYDTITVYAAELNQPLYEKLRATIKEVEEKLSKEEKKRNKFLLDNDDNHAVKIGFFCDKLSDVLPLSSFSPDQQNLVIFDDFITEKHQDIITEYYIRGRHKNVSCLYLSQSYTRTPINIRRNCDYFFIYQMSGRDANLIYQDHIDSSISKDKFKELFEIATKDPYSFLMIDLKTKTPQMRYRKNFDTFLI